MSPRVRFVQNGRDRAQAGGRRRAQQPLRVGGARANPKRSVEPVALSSMHRGRGGVAALAMVLAVALLGACSSRPQGDKLAAPLRGGVVAPPDAATTTTVAPADENAYVAAAAPHAAAPAPSPPTTGVDPLGAAMDGINACLIVVKGT